ncbi:MAG: phosphatase PAP2 family protein [Candidatus Nanoarchaeia archaeon]|nr:phosphatase PAP2 family protein [Candidatus Haiyanarchaeum thermophilum]MCW1302912.1 phosphatase PAP2 family protein [Candidatus Haiyanarchaeum thermophilum]MCW1303591.1 phosphatase PAP2 family protein [Candidatus Haiyanarchaeum thermophilum]MCW1306273.1 phosphatase PAP2 family protein [Candidatus Haiyanarchaeum thermophilum]MCW1307491.1 phosphatase PAP2 family protein [Candidatus Haiyanarchaeum thermophilum]
MSWEEDVIDVFQTTKNPILDYLALLFDFLFSAPFLLLILCLALLIKRDKKIFLILFGLLLNYLVVIILKLLFALPRPAGNRRDSFPSGHTANAFFIAKASSRYVKYSSGPLYFIAFLVAISRLYLAAHYPLDVIGGAIVGYLIAWLVLKFEREIFEIFKTIRSKTSPKRKK